MTEDERRKRERQQFWHDFGDELPLIILGLAATLGALAFLWVLAANVLQRLLES